MKKVLLGILGASVLGLTGLSASASANTVTVKQGDTVSELASQYNTSVSAIQQLNNLANVNMIYVNEQLQVNNQAVTPSKSINSTQQTNTSSNVQNSSNSSSQASIATVASFNTSTSEQQASTNSSVKSQFIAAGGTEELWNSIVIPESGGNQNAVNGQYHGLGQTNQSWGYGSVANQTQGMINYAVSRYGSIEKAVQFRNQEGFW